MGVRSWLVIVDAASNKIQVTAAKRGSSGGVFSSGNASVRGTQFCGRVKITGLGFKEHLTCVDRTNLQFTIQYESPDGSESSTVFGQCEKVSNQF